MKQAILITAYKNFHHLCKIINHFDENFCFYIHIDKKSKISMSEIESLKKIGKFVFISQEYKTNWGGVNHLKCSLLLLKESLKNKELEYFHLISGHDYPIKSSTYFHDFLSKNKGKQFLEYFTLPAKVWENGGMERLELFNLHDIINAKGKYNVLIGRFNQLQRKLGFKRKLNFNNLQLYGGGTWWSFSRECCEFISTYVDSNPQFLKKFNYTFCAEEIFYQTLILNSPFKNNVVNDHLRHILWEFKNGNVPGNLDESDYDSIISSTHLFARRFEYPVSEGLLYKLES